MTEDLQALVRRVILQALEVAGADLAGEQVEVSVTFVDDDTIQGLNKEHRGLDKPTDVLSFAQLEGEDVPLAEDEPVMLGDLVISLERARDQAEQFGHSFERELGFLTAHGMLHLLGYDHQTDAEHEEMTRVTEQILAPLGLTRE